MLHMKSYTISTSKGDIYMVLHGPKWDVVSAGHWLEHVCTDRVSHHILFSVASSLYALYPISNVFSASCLTAFCELCYTICIAITLH